MGHAFFRIVGIFSYVVGALTLLCAAGFGISALGNWTDASDDSGVEVDAPTVDDYVRGMLGENLDPQAREALEQFAEQLDVVVGDGDTAETSDATARVFSDAEREVVSRLTGRVQRAASKQGQGALDFTDFQTGLLITLDALGLENEDERLQMLSGLNAAVERMYESGGDGLAPGVGVTIDGVNRFYSWYVDAYADRLAAQRLARTEARAEAKLAAMIQAGIAGVAFLIFVFFTLILLMVRIEWNTRRTEERLERLRDALGIRESSTSSSPAQSPPIPAELLQSLIGRLDTNSKVMMLWLKSNGPKPGGGQG